MAGTAPHQHDDTPRGLPAPPPSTGCGRSFALIQSWNEEPVKRPVLVGDRQDPYLALDPYRMKVEGWSERSSRKFQWLCDPDHLLTLSFSLRLP